MACEFGMPGWGLLCTPPNVVKNSGEARRKLVNHATTHTSMSGITGHVLIADVRGRLIGNLNNGISNVSLQGKKITSGVYILRIKNGTTDELRRVSVTGK